MNPLDQKKAGTAEDDGGKTKRSDLPSRGSVPKLLKKSAGGESCCIFRIPRRPESNKTNYYEPSVVSVGPYHHGKKHLQMIQEHKQGYLELFMDEARKKDVEMKDLVEAVSLLEEDIMDSYSENLDLAEGFDRKKLIDMMVLDGCFILMLFLVVTKKVKYTKSDDPVFRTRWILPAIRKDLLLLENQVPFFLLQTIFDKSKIVTSSGLNEITFEFFRSSMSKINKISLEHRNIKAKHLLDLIRKTLLPLKPTKENRDSISRPFLKLISSVKDLRVTGIKFKTRNSAKTFLEMKMKRGIIEIPPLVLDDLIISIFRNCVAFEQFYGGCTNHITSYIAFIGCLIRNEDDAKFLIKLGIIENYFGIEEDISVIFKDIGKDISFDLHESYLAEVFEEVNRYAARRWNVFKEELLYKYFDGPMGLYQFYSGLMLLVFTFAQVYLAAYQSLDSSRGK